jgi:hypothetical protein
MNLDEDPVYCECRQFLDDLRETCQGCTWKAEVSFFDLHRSTPGTQPVLFDPTTNANLFEASRLTFPFASGPRVSLTALDCEGWGFELNYFGIDNWSTTYNIPNGALPSRLANITVDNETKLSVTDAEFASMARLYSTEVNFRRPLYGNSSILAGFRWIEMTDKYLFDGTSASTANILSESVLTHNHLYGFQLGSDGTIAKEDGRWRLNGFVKGGVFLNSADQATALNDPNGLGYRAANYNHDGAAFFGESGVVGYFQITKHLSASGGYEVMFVNNVAQPANQISATNLVDSSKPTSVDTSSGLFYHGATAGLELTW